MCIFQYIMYACVLVRKRCALIIHKAYNHHPPFTVYIHSFVLVGKFLDFASTAHRVHVHFILLYLSFSRYLFLRVSATTFKEIVAAFVFGDAFVLVFGQTSHSIDTNQNVNSLSKVLKCHYDVWSFESRGKLCWFS